MKTNVVFKKFADGDVIALFPDYKCQEMHGETMIDSYMHEGQHSHSHIDLLEELEDATTTEYKELFEELTNLIGYELNVIGGINE